jgi:hypothetical protein
LAFSMVFLSGMTTSLDVFWLADLHEFQVFL